MTTQQPDLAKGFYQLYCKMLIQTSANARLHE